MQYLLTIYADESTWVDATPEQIAEVMAAHNAFSDEARKAGVLVGGEALEPTATATTVRVRDGEPLLTDGPFAETREQLGGYYVVECAGLDEAVRWGAKVPEAATGCVEVRPIIDFSAMEAGAPADDAAARG